MRRALLLALALALAPQMAQAKCYGTSAELRRNQCATFAQARKAHPTAHLLWTRRLSPSPSYPGDSHTTSTNTSPKTHPSPWLVPRPIRYWNIPSGIFLPMTQRPDFVGGRFNEETPWWYRY